MKNISRREFIEKSGIGIAGLAISTQGNNQTKPKTAIPFQLGIASYTFRNYSLEKSLEMAVRLNIRRLSLKSMHLPLESTADDIKKAMDMCKKAGVEIYGAGVIYMNKKEEVDQAFNYAGMAGMKIIIGVPAHDLLAYTEQMVKKTGIKVAIHNHGPGDEVYPSPESIYSRIKDLDKGIGICLDIGHTIRIGLNPATEAKKYAGRLLDMHIKDVTAATAEGDTAEMGRGVIDLPAFFREITKLGFSGTASFEYEKDENDVLPGLAESVGYTRGILAML
ncbi:MAG TPA: sugar phosphate isomerase/epimerase [Cyclobacteriaceae bacterium]|nr:sugar phosphate isomerase/epimerase [Cyclobacteriaceae bacterium]